MMVFGGGVALRMAARQGRVDEVHALLDTGVDPDTVSSQKHRFFKPWIHGRSALWHAVVGNHLQVVDLLLGHGANPNAIGWLGSTPLWTACCIGNAEMVVRLLAAGAHPDLKGCRGSSPLEAWVGSCAIPQVAGTSLGVSLQAMEIGALLSQAGAQLDTMAGMMEHAEQLLRQAGCPSGLLVSSCVLGELCAEHEYRKMQQSSVVAIAPNTPARL